MKLMVIVSAAIAKASDGENVCHLCDRPLPWTLTLILSCCSFCNCLCSAKWHSMAICRRGKLGAALCQCGLCRLESSTRNVLTSARA